MKLNMRVPLCCHPPVWALPHQVGWELHAQPQTKGQMKWLRMFTGWNSTCQRQICGWGLSCSTVTHLSLSLSSHSLRSPGLCCQLPLWLKSSDGVGRNGLLSIPPMTSVCSHLAVRKHKPEAFAPIISILWWTWFVGYLWFWALLLLLPRKCKRHTLYPHESKHKHVCMQSLWSVFLLGYCPMTLFSI